MRIGEQRSREAIGAAIYAGMLRSWPFALILVLFACGDDVRVGRDGAPDDPDMRFVDAQPIDAPFDPDASCATATAGAMLDVLDGLGTDAVIGVATVGQSCHCIASLCPRVVAISPCGRSGCFRCCGFSRFCIFYRFF